MHYHRRLSSPLRRILNMWCWSCSGLVPSQAWELRRAINSCSVYLRRRFIFLKISWLLCKDMTVKLYRALRVSYGQLRHLCLRGRLLRALGIVSLLNEFAQKDIMPSSSESMKTHRGLNLGVEDDWSSFAWGPPGEGWPITNFLHEFTLDVYDEPIENLMTIQNPSRKSLSTL